MIQRNFWTLENLQALRKEYIIVPQLDIVDGVSYMAGDVRECVL